MVYRAGKLVAVAIILAALHLTCTGASASVDCQQQLDLLWANYTNPTVPISGCDSECLFQCKDTIEQAMYTTQIQDCPPQTNITNCLHIFSDAWEEYAKDCDLFVISNTSTIQGATSEGESGQSTTSSPSPGASPEASPEVSPAASPEASPEAVSAPEAGRRLMAEASFGEGGSSAGVCFPTFSSLSEVEAYIDGEYFEEDYSAPSNTAGIVLSVVFWTSFAALGLLLRR